MANFITGKSRAMMRAIEEGKNPGMPQSEWIAMNDAYNQAKEGGTITGARGGISTSIRRMHDAVGGFGSSSSSSRGRADDGPDLDEIMPMAFFAIAGLLAFLNSGDASATIHATSSPEILGAIRDSLMVGVAEAKEMLANSETIQTIKGGPDLETIQLKVNEVAQVAGENVKVAIDKIKDFLPGPT